jgi:nucleoside-diphosphate-sugar epimerase
MKVLLAGASGAIGGPLVRELTAAGHHVIGLTRSSTKAERLTSAGVQPVIADVMDRDGLLRALRGTRADALIHELTDLTKPPVRHRDMVRTNLLRTTGTEHLLAAAHEVGATRFLTQSIVLGYGYRDHGSTPLDETAPFGLPESGPCNPHVAAMLANERAVLDAPQLDGIALRYGLFYGGDGETFRQLLQQRKVPIPARADNPLAWIHVVDAARATVAALEHGVAGSAYNIVDDEAVSWAQMLTETADAYGAPAPRRLPGWLIRAAAPYVAAMVLDTSIRVSNTKAKNELGWAPHYPTYRHGLRALGTNV